MIRRLLRFVVVMALRVFALAAILVVALYAFRDPLLRAGIERRLQKITGLETQLGEVHTDPASWSITLRNLVIQNAPEFGGGPLISAPEVHLEWDAHALLQREVRLLLARVQIDEVSIVRNQAGATNVVELLGHATRNASAADAVIASPPGFEFEGVETLQLTFGTLHMLDMLQTGNTRDFHVSITNEILRNVRSTADFSPLVMRVLIREVSSGFRSGLAAPPTAPPRP